MIGARPLNLKTVKIANESTFNATVNFDYGQDVKYSGRRGYRDIANPGDDSSDYDLDKHATRGNQPAFGFPIFYFTGEDCDDSQYLGLKNMLAYSKERIAHDYILH